MTTVDRSKENGAALCAGDRDAQQEKKRWQRSKNLRTHVSGAAEQAMEQARSAADIYFEYVKQAISATPSGGSEFAEALKECAQKNITAT